MGPECTTRDCGLPRAAGDWKCSGCRATADGLRRRYGARMWPRPDGTIEVEP